MKIKDKKVINTWLMLVLIICLVCFGLVFYNAHLKSNLHTSTEATLIEILEQQKFNFDSEIKAEINTIKSLAISLSYIPENKENVEDLMNEAMEQCNFDDMMVVTAQGKGLTSNGEIIDVSNEEYFKRTINGETLVADFVTEQYDEKIVLISTPIIRHGEINGVLSCSYELERFNNLLLSSFGGRGYAYVITAEGNIIAKTKNDYALLKGNNIFTALEHVNIERYDNVDTIKQNIQEGKRGKIEYGVGKESRHAHYARLDTNGWYLFAVVPEEVVELNASDIMSGAIILTCSIVVIFICFLLYVMFLQKQSDNDKADHTSELERVAYYDDLTGMPNLNKFKIDAYNVLTSNPDKIFVAAKIDIVNFKVLNEMFGYEVADKAIYYMAKLIMDVKKDMDIKMGCLARINADEFILLDEANTLEETYERIKRFEITYNQIAKGILGSHKIRFRYGRCMTIPGETDINNIIEKVNMAHRTAKQENQTIYDYNDTILDKYIREAELESMMSSSIEKGEFKVYLQPKYLLSNETIVGAEALVRWKLSDGEMILPNDFIPLFERNGSVIKLDMYMFEQVCKMISAFLDRGIEPVPISVNFSKTHLQNENFVKDIDDIAQKYNTPKKYLEIELTESSIYDNEVTLRELIDKLHHSGFTLSMDDFGSGYSSLGLLKSLPVDTIKIDKGFFSDILYESRAKTVIESVIEMSKKLCIGTVAEGVETKEHIDLLKEIGCDVVQGYYYSKPMPAEEFFKSIENNATINQ